MVRSTAGDIIKIAVFVLIPAMAIALALLSAFAWFPDILSSREVVVARVSVGENGAIDLTQRWVGDGYLTQVRHTLRSGEVLRVTGDPDAAKVWRARLELMTNSASVRIRFRGHDWGYYYLLQELSFDGKSQSAY